MFQSFDHSPAYQLKKKHYPEIYQKMMANEIEDCSNVFRQNIEKGIKSDCIAQKLILMQLGNFITP
jgi:hypothetical protein